MAHVVITSGPTRQYLDPVRYITNASSGRMGAALADAALHFKHAVTIVTGPVSVSYPRRAHVISVQTTEEMFIEARKAFEQADGLIGAAAPCDYRPRRVATQKMAKTGQPLLLELVETEDIIASLAATKMPHQWVVGFALETEDRHFRAITKMQKKSCDLMVSNGPEAIDAEESQVEIYKRGGELVGQCTGTKKKIGRDIFTIIHKTFCS